MPVTRIFLHGYVGDWTNLSVIDADTGLPITDIVSLSLSLEVQAVTTAVFRRRNSTAHEKAQVIQPDTYWAAGETYLNAKVTTKVRHDPQNQRAVFDASCGVHTSRQWIDDHALITSQDPKAVVRANCITVAQTLGKAIFADALWYDATNVPQLTAICQRGNPPAQAAASTLKPPVAIPVPPTPPVTVGTIKLQGRGTGFIIEPAKSPKTGACPECGGSGIVRLFTSDAPCSKGCKPPGAVRAGALILTLRKDDLVIVDDIPGTGWGAFEGHVRHDYDSAHHVSLTVVNKGGGAHSIPTEDVLKYVRLWKP